MTIILLLITLEFFGEYIFYPSAKSHFLMTTQQNAMLLQYLTLQYIPKLDPHPSIAQFVFSEPQPLIPSSRRPPGVKQIVF